MERIVQRHPFSAPQNCSVSPSFTPRMVPRNMLHALFVPTFFVTGGALVLADQGVCLVRLCVVSVPTHSWEVFCATCAS